MSKKTGILIEMSIAPLKSIRYWKSWGVLENPADILHDRHENAQNWWRNGLRKINLKLATPSQLNQNSLYWICPIFRGGVANYKLIFLRNSSTICENFDANYVEFMFNFPKMPQHLFQLLSILDKLWPYQWGSLFWHLEECLTVK